MALRIVLALLFLTSTTGCRSSNLPLIGKLFDKDRESESSVPPRYSFAENDDDMDAPPGRANVQLSNEDSQIELTEFSPDQGSPRQFSGADVVATVNSLPIFASDVLEPYAPNLARAEEQLTPQEMNRLRAELIRKSIRPHIEKAVLVSALEQSLEREQLEGLQAQINSLFKEEEERLKKEFKVSERIELERLLQKQGTSLANLKYQFANREMAMFYLGKNAIPPALLSRKDLEAWYEENKDQYRHDAMVKSQQIRISHSSKNGGRDGARSRLREAVDLLKKNVSFDEVAQQFSDGPKASNGGHWDWIPKGSLAEKQVERALFELPVQEISAPIESRNAFVIVVAIDRKEETFTPFEEVQDDIRKQLENTARQEAVTKALTELVEAASIQTMLPAPPAARPAGGARK